MRSKLQSGNKISLYNSINIKTVFEIIECIGEGGSSVCYTAKNIMNNKRGRLKELYPHNIDLNRDSNNNLIIDNSVSYSKEKEYFLNAYNLLNQVQVDRTDDLLNNFIPNSTLFFSNENGYGAIYVWTEYDYSGITFEEYLINTLNDNTIQPAIKVSHILECIITLTKCIGYLHSVGILHNDIKPANFLVLFDADGNINTHAISLFDINSISRIYVKPSRISISQGYTAPEVFRNGRTSVKSDIYSIGSMLLLPFVITDNLEYRYKDTDYSNIKAMLDNSSLLFDIPLPFLVYEFIEELEFILKSCLNFSRSKRYKTCTDLHRNLNNLLVYLMDEVAREEAESIIKYSRDFTSTNTNIISKLSNKYKINIEKLDDKLDNLSKKTMTITSSGGKEETVEILFSFEFNDNHREFVLYTKNETDIFGNTTIYAANVTRERNSTTLGNILDEDWPRIVDFINELGQETPAKNEEKNDNQSNSLVDIITNKINSFSHEYNTAISLLREQKYNIAKKHLKNIVKISDELLQIYTITKSTEYNLTLKKVAASFSYLAFCYPKKHDLYKNYLIEAAKKAEEYSKNTGNNKELKLFIYPKLIELYKELNDIENLNLYQNKLNNLT